MNSSNHIYVYSLQEMLELVKNYHKAVEEEDTMTPEQRAIKNVGKQVCSYMLLTVKMLDECNSSNVKFQCSILDLQYEH